MTGASNVPPAGDDGVAASAPAHRRGGLFSGPSSPGRRSTDGGRHPAGSFPGHRHFDPAADGLMSPSGRELPGAESYLKFSFEELGEQLGVRPGELVAALARNENTFEFELPPADTTGPGTPSGRTPAPSEPPGTPPPERERAVSSLLIFVPTTEDLAEYPASLENEPALEPENIVHVPDTTGIVRPMSSLLEDMQQSVLDASARAPESEAAADYDLEVPLLINQQEDLVLPSGVSVSASVRSRMFDIDDEAVGYLVKVPDFSESDLISPFQEMIDQQGFDDGTFSVQSLPKDSHTSSYMLAVPDHTAQMEEATATFPSLVMPSDIEYVSIKPHYEEEQLGQEAHVDGVTLTVHRRAPIMGYALLTLAVWAISTIGSGFIMEDIVHPLLKSAWRCAVALIIFTPWMIATMYLNPNSIRVLRDPRITFDLVLTSVAQSQYLFWFVVALDYTSIETAFLLSNCHSMLIVLFRLLTGVPVSAMSIFGVLISLGGAGLTILDSNGSGSQSTTAALIGAGTAFLSGVTGAIYVTTAGKVRPKVDFAVFLWVLFVVQLFLFLGLLAGLAYLQGIPLDTVLTFGFDPNTGLFGWATKQRCFAALLVGVVGTALGTCMYIAVLKYLDPVVVSVAMLTEPFCGVFTGVMLGQSGWPALWGWAGSGISVLGALVVVAGTRRRNVTAVVKVE